MIDIDKQPSISRQTSMLVSPYQTDDFVPEGFEGSGCGRRQSCRCWCTWNHVDKWHKQPTSYTWRNNGDKNSRVPQQHRTKRHSGQIKARGFFIRYDTDITLGAPSAWPTIYYPKDEKRWSHTSTQDNGVMASGGERKLFSFRLGFLLHDRMTYQKSMMCSLERWQMQCQENRVCSLLSVSIQ